MLDYTVGALLIASPWLFRFNDIQSAMLVPVLLGISALVYSLITQYEYSAAKLIPFPVHLVLDTFSGILLAASPWIFGFNDHVYVPHLVLGIMEIIAVLLTDKRPRTAMGKLKR